MSDLAPGIDVSRWEGVIEWQAVKDSGLVEFAIIKATEGDDFIDPQFTNNKSGAIAVSMPWGAFHYFHPTEDVVTQANLFVQAVGENCPVYVLDLETITLSVIYGTASARKLRGSPLPETLRAQWYRKQVNGGLIEAAKLFLDTVETLIGLKPVIYTSPYFWNTYMVPTPPWTPEYDLWVAHWTDKPQPVLPDGWSEWTFWQYTDLGFIPGIPSAVDLDRFNGDVLAMQEYFSIQITRNYLPFVSR